MKKLTRAEIQSLSDAELNHWLSSYRAEPTGKLYSIPNYCRSLDDQFELAEKLNIYFEIRHYHKDKGVYRIDYNGFIERQAAKRTGAELLLEAIQELEVVK